MIKIFIVAFNIMFMESSTGYRNSILMVSTKSIEELVYDYEDDKNGMIAVAERDNEELYEDFYDEMDNGIKIEPSMDIIFFGPTDSFMRLDPETIIHILVLTKKYLIPISRVLLAWDLVTDGETAAFLQGRELAAFGTLLNLVPEEDLYHINFADITVLNYFSKHNVHLQNRKLGILVAAYMRFFGNDWYRNATYINQLGYLFCGFPPRDFARISPETFRQISLDVLNKLERCNIEQQQTLYKIATDPEVYGKPFRWSSNEVNRLGSLFIYISEDDLSSIHLEAVSAISPDVMRDMNQNKLQYFTKQQVMRMNHKTRRIYILRMHLKSSLDMGQLTRKYAYRTSSCIRLLIVSVVTLTI